MSNLTFSNWPAAMQLQALDVSIARVEAEAVEATIRIQDAIEIGDQDLRRMENRRLVQLGVYRGKLGTLRMKASQKLYQENKRRVASEKL